MSNGADDPNEDEAERTREFIEMGNLCATWRLRGIHPVVMAVRLMQCSLIISEQLGIACEAVQKHVHDFYHPPAPERPAAKA